MIAYIDASVLLRIALGERGALPQWKQIDHGVSSSLIRVESLRTLDRLRRRLNLPDIEVARRRATILALINAMEIVELDSTVLDRAAQPMPTELGTFDAIHLVSALLWQEVRQNTLTLATHDTALATAAQAHGLAVLG